MHFKGVQQSYSSMALSSRGKFVLPVWGISLLPQCHTQRQFSYAREVLTARPADEYWGPILGILPSHCFQPWVSSTTLATPTVNVKVVPLRWAIGCACTGALIQDTVTPQSCTLAKLGVPPPCTSVPSWNCFGDLWSRMLHLMASWAWAL